MKIKRIIIFIIITSLISISVLLYIYPYLQNINHNNNFDDEINIKIKALVYNALDFRYRRYFSFLDINSIFTDDFIKELSPGIYSNDLFYIIIYTDFMETLRKIEDNEFYLSVRTGGFLSDDIYQHITIIINEEGNFLISNIGLDP